MFLGQNSVDRELLLQMNCNTYLYINVNLNMR